MSNATQQTGAYAPAEPGEIERLKEELRREHEMHVEALAEFDSLRRRAERDCAKAAGDSKRAILLSLIELADSFDNERASVSKAGIEPGDALESLHKKVLALLAKNGVFPVVAFDGTVDEDIADKDIRATSGSGERDERRAAIGQARPGYRWGSELLRPAEPITTG